MKVEIFIEGASIYYTTRDNVKLYLCAEPGTPFKEVEPISSALNSEEIVELSKAGIRADEIIRLRKEGII